MNGADGHSGTTISLTRERLRRKPVIYTVVICHDAIGMTFTVHDVQDTTKDRLAVATDLEAAAASLREAAE
jgi:hypothetical protein